MSNGNFTPDADSEKSMKCDVCDIDMEVERGIFGSTSFASSMAGKKVKYDHFKCKFRDTDWHLQAYQLFKEAENTPSGILSGLLEREAASIIISKKATKQINKWF